jgi:hypothetical protein
MLAYGGRCSCGVGVYVIASTELKVEGRANQRTWRGPPTSLAEPPMSGIPVGARSRSVVLPAVVGGNFAPPCSSYNIKRSGS